MTDFLDALETREPDQREAALMAALPGQVTAAMRAPAFAERFAGADAQQIDSRAALATLPLTEDERADIAGRNFRRWVGLGR